MIDRFLVLVPALQGRRTSRCVGAWADGDGQDGEQPTRPPPSPPPPLTTPSWSLSRPPRRWTCVLKLPWGNNVPQDHASPSAHWQSSLSHADILCAPHPPPGHGKRTPQGANMLHACPLGSAPSPYVPRRRRLTRPPPPPPAVPRSLTASFSSPPSPPPQTQVPLTPRTPTWAGQQARCHARLYGALAAHLLWSVLCGGHRHPSRQPPAHPMALLGTPHRHATAEHDAQVHRPLGVAVACHGIHQHVRYAVKSVGMILA